jgi:RNA polymerase sigma-70 factor (ECF subfamily)
MEWQALLDRARAGDRTAWNLLLGQMRPWVRALVRPAPAKDLDASDLTQEVQLRMDRGFARFRGETIGQLIAWVRTIAANVLYDYYRCPRAPLLALPDDLAAPEPPTPVADPEDMAWLLRTLEELPGHYRQVVEGRLLKGLSCVEVAQQMGQLPGTVRTWWLRAAEELSRRLGARS